MYRFIVRLFIICIICLIFIFNAINVPAHAALIWDWNFDDPSPIVGPTETVTMTATIYNDISSDQGLTIQTYTIKLLFLAEYNFLPGDGLGIYVGPGESQAFTFGTLTPIGGYAAPGVYDDPLNYETRVMVSDGSIVDEIGKEYSLTVVNTIPEPSTLPLLFTGLIGLVGIRKRFET